MKAWLSQEDEEGSSAIHSSSMNIGVFFIVKWMHTLETLQRNLQVCQVSQECLWQVFVWNIFWRLEGFCSVCICISCKLVSSASREGMSQAFGQISFGTRTDFTLCSLLAPVLPLWLVAPTTSNLSIKWSYFSEWGVVSKLTWVTRRQPYKNISTVWFLQRICSRCILCQLLRQWKYLCLRLVWSFCWHFRKESTSHIGFQPLSTLRKMGCNADGQFPVVLEDLGAVLD